MWHASVAVVAPGGVLDTGELRPKEARRAKEIALELLAGVGTGEIRRDRAPVCFHARRRLSDRELAQLDPAWCAIPPVDMAGGGEPW